MTDSGITTSSQPGAQADVGGRKPRGQLPPGWLLLILTGLNLLNYLDRNVLNAVRTPMADAFGVSYGDSGKMFTAFMIGYFVTSPIFGWLGDRWSRKWLIA